MKKIIPIIIFLIMMCLPISVLANPFLICDDPIPSEKITNYLITIDGGEIITLPCPLHFDLGEIGEGTHTIKVAAANLWGSSMFSTFDFTKTTPSPPQSISISINHLITVTVH